ncbi:hypothetical protein CH371_11175 [Leptospira wolffii]|uniref:DNA 3'-5' helicase n=1 Tax=Leptospira wolffii TaxID=409998 RepID=A0A2M9ZCK6_9LEPT|nr:ATP-dependent helicase [Leptospira wolffii]PJZ66067.1 hypothetical protein CH371_11175 [Leptospira wolffii]
MKEGTNDSPMLLNQSQLEAVSWNEGPLLVLAGPGSGKTTVLTHRIIRLIKESPEQRFRILALTFTQNAANNMRLKIDNEIVEERNRANLTTFHSFCADVIRQHGALADIQTDFSIMTTDLDREELLLEVIQDLTKAGFNYKREDVRYLPKINSLMEQCLVLDKPPTPNSELNQVRFLFYHYLSRMKSTGRIDYSGILYFAWVLLGLKQVSKHYSVVYKYICIDEYQDTNLAQFNILTRLVKQENPNLFIVADDDQIVYQWNGASPERLHQIIDTYKLPVLQLPENYRCPPAVVEIANKMIGHNRNRYGAKKPGISLSSSKNDKSILLKKFSTFDDEIKWISEDLIKQKRSPGNTKIMGRTRKILEDAQKILEQNGTLAALRQRKAEFESPPLRFLHSLSRLLISRADKVQIQRLSSSFYQLEGVNIDVHEVIGTGSLTNGDLLKAWIKIVLEKNNVSADTKNFFSSIKFDKELLYYSDFFQKTFTWLDQIQNTDVHQSQNVFDDYKSEKEIWDFLFKDIHSSTNTDITLSVYLQELDLRDKAEPIPFGAFELITIHGAKGLEFEHVYLIAMVDDIIPSYNSIKVGVRPEALEEERRACYVAITRTQKTLTMSFANRYGSWQKSPSRFLREMGILT